MLKEILEQNYLMYGILGVCAIGILGRILAYLGYSRYARAAGKIPDTRNKLMKRMKMKFENCYKLNLGVHNIPLFVDKYLSKTRFLGIRLHRLNRLPGDAMRLSVVLGCAGAFLCYYYGYPTENITAYLVAGGAGIALTAAVSGLLDVNFKKELMVVNACDYLENSMANRLSHQYMDKKEAAAAGILDPDEQDDNLLTMNPEVESEIASMKRSLEQIAAGSAKRQEDYQRDLSAVEEEEVIQEILTEYLA